MILNLRGTCGAGKSHVGHRLATLATETFEIEVGHELNKNKTKPRHVAYGLPGGLCVLGQYTAACGGVEGWKMEHARELVRRASRWFDHVFFEGYYISMGAGPWIKVGRELATERVKALPFVILALDTPFEVCMARVQQRNGGKPINEEVQRGQFGAYRRHHQRLLESGAFAAVRWIDHTRAYEQVIATLREGGWRP